MTIPFQSNLSAEKFPAEMRETVEEWARALNGFQSSTLDLVDGKLSLAKNSVNDYVTLRVVGGAFPYSFRVGGGPKPTGAIVTQLLDASTKKPVLVAAPYAAVEYRGDQAYLRNITGLTAGTAYLVNLLVIREEPTPIGATQDQKNAAVVASDPNGWTEFPRLLNGWKNYGDRHEAAAYRKDALGVVHIKGLVKAGNTDTDIAVLPEGFRPGAIAVFPATSQGTTAESRIHVHTDGRVTAYAVAATNNAFLSIVCSFYAEK